MNYALMSSEYSRIDTGYILEKVVEIPHGQTVTLIDFLATECHTQHTQITFILHPHSNLFFTFILGSAQVTHYSIKIQLIGSGTHAAIIGLGSYSDKQQVTITSSQEHAIADTDSKIIVRSILDGQAALHYTGIIDVALNAQRSCASQQATQLLLSSQARAITIPALQVKAHQVQCAHGTATGQLDKEALWYASSRGIEYELAKKLILESFFGQELADCDPDLKRSIMNYLLKNKEV